MYLRKKVLPEVLQFAKAQVSAFFGGLVDFITMIVLTEFFGFFYPVSIMLGGIVGAVANFSINKLWAFKEGEDQTLTQALKFCVVLVGSILLKASGTYWITESLGIEYWIGRLVVDAFVCFGFNYVLHRIWVFR